MLQSSSTVGYLVQERKLFSEKRNACIQNQPADHKRTQTETQKAKKKITLSNKMEKQTNRQTDKQTNRQTAKKSKGSKEIQE